MRYGKNHNPSWRHHCDNRTFFLEISVLNVENSTEIGLTNTIMTKQKIINCHDNTFNNTSFESEDVIKIKTVLTKIDDALSIKWSDSLKIKS